MYRYSKSIIVLVVTIALTFPANYSLATDLHLMLADLNNLLNNLPDSSFANSRIPYKYKDILSVEINKVDEAITEAETETNTEQQRVIYGKAIKLLEHMSIKTDGCINTGFPEKNDYISECEDQEQVHTAITNIITSIKQLIPI